MRVLMIAWEYPPHIVGGLGRHVYHLSKTMASKGADVSVLTFTDGSSPPEEEVDGVSVIRVNPYLMRYPDFISYIQGLNFLMVERASKIDYIDIIHVHDWLSAYAGIALKHMKRKPLISTIHATEMGRRGVLNNDAERHIHEMEWWLAFESWKILCCSRYMLQSVSRELNCPADKITVMPNGYDPVLLKQAKSAEQEAVHPGDPKIVLFVGRLVHEKGAQLLIEAASLLKRDSLRFVVVGEGAMKPYLEALARKLGVSQQVQFKGYVTDHDLLSIYLRASIFVVPSLYEPFGIVALEAMSMEVPVIVSSTGGLDEIIRDEFNGLKFTQGSPPSLASKIDRLLNDPELAARLVANARESVKEYSWVRVAEETLEIYNKVLEEHERGSWKPRR